MENITLYQFVVFFIGAGGISSLSQLSRVKEIRDKEIFDGFKEIYNERSQYGPRTLKDKAKTARRQLFSLQFIIYLFLEILLIWWIIDLNINGNKNFIFTLLFEKPEEVTVTKAFQIFTILLGFINSFVFIVQTIVPWIKLLILYFKAIYSIRTEKI